MIRGAYLLFSALALLIAACAAPSVQQSDARDRQTEYERAYKEFYSAEKDYLNILYNLESHPLDSFLLENRQLKRKEIEHLRNVMLQSRTELEQSVQQWEAYLNELRSLPAPAELPSHVPTSPGHLVPSQNQWQGR